MLQGLPATARAGRSHFWFGGDQSDSSCQPDPSRMDPQHYGSKTSKMAPPIFLHPEKTECRSKITRIQLLVFVEATKMQSWVLNSWNANCSEEMFSLRSLPTWTSHRFWWGVPAGLYHLQAMVFDGGNPPALSSTKCGCQPNNEAKQTKCSKCLKRK